MKDISHTAEFVFPGHPDKLSDAIADALVQEASLREKRALTGVEVAVHRNSVFVTGRIGCVDAKEIDVADIIKDVYRSAGYGGDWGPEPDDLSVRADLCLGPLEDGEAEFRSLSDDQSICTGYATATAETNYLPVEHWLAKMVDTSFRSDPEQPVPDENTWGRVVEFFETYGPRFEQTMIDALAKIRAEE